MWQQTKKALTALLKFAIHAYQILLSPVLGNNCKFYPNCSNYALDAIDKHGPIIGLWLSARRVARCNPWSAGGIDPVPLPRQTPYMNSRTTIVSSRVGTDT